MDWTLAVVVVPVGDIDRAIAFYREQLGFDLDHHTKAPGMDFAQLTPRGSGCSIVVGELRGWPAMPTRSLKALQLIVADAYRASDELLSRGVETSEIEVIDERDGGTLFGFSAPDRNT